MFTNFEDFLHHQASLEVSKDGIPTSREVQVAVIALLHDTALSSNGLGEYELTRMIGALFLEFGLHDADGADLLEIAEFMKRNEGSSDRFVGAVNEHFDIDQKERVLAYVWRVIAADGHADQSEAVFASELRKKLGLTLEQAFRAQRMSSTLGVE